MPFPDHIARVFDAFGIAADTKDVLYDLYVAMGDEVLEVFDDIAENVDSPATLRPEDCAPIRARVVERYLRRNHPRWAAGLPTPSLYHPRAFEGRVSGAAIPLGDVQPETAGLLEDDQAVPEGILMQGRNAHFGGRQETISFDFVAAELDDALAIGLAEGQQHTLPGSVGETSGTLDAVNGVALLWEIQPNVYKPAGDRNRDIARVYRRHRNWHIVTLVAALQWLRNRGVKLYVVRGEALAATHEVNPEKPVSETIVALHNRTVEHVTRGLGLTLNPATRDDELVLLNASVMNTGLHKHVTLFGAGGAVTFDGKIYDKVVVKAGGVRVVSKTFTLPDVQPGSILEYSYERSFREGYHSRFFAIQRELPVLRELVWMRPFPSGISTLRVSYKGLPPGKKPMEVGDHFELEIENIAAYEEEPYAPPEDCVKPMVIFYYSDP